MSKPKLRDTVYPIPNDNDVRNKEYQEISRKLNSDNSIRCRTNAIKSYQRLAENGEKKAWVKIYKVFKLYMLDEMLNYYSPQALIAAKLSHQNLKIYGINSQEAFRCLTKGAILGDEYAQGWLGLEYRYSVYGHTNTVASIKWLRTAALNGCVASQFNLAVSLVKNFPIEEVQLEVTSLYYAVETFKNKNPNNADRFREQAMRDLSYYII